MGGGGCFSWFLCDNCYTYYLLSTIFLCNYLAGFFSPAGAKCTKKDSAGDYGIHLHVQKLCGTRSEEGNWAKWSGKSRSILVLISKSNSWWHPQALRQRGFTCLLKLHARRNFNWQNFSHHGICARQMAHARTFHLRSHMGGKVY